MKNFGRPKTKQLSGFTWIQVGLASLRGNAMFRITFTTVSPQVQSITSTIAGIGYTRSW
jgi:hypothetical protein